MQKLLMQDARQYSTFRLPALLHEVLLCQSVDDLSALNLARPPLVLGEGSNSIFLTDICRPVLRYVATALQVRYAKDKVLLHVEAGYNWHQLVTYSVQQGWWGLENLALIPGSVGAAPVQNIGAYGCEFVDFCNYVDFFHWHSKTVQRISAVDCQFGYRDSIFKQALSGQGVIVAVGLTLQVAGQPKLTYRGLDHLPANSSLDTVYQTVCNVRRSKLPDPAILSNCGSFFKNPVLDTAQFYQLQQKFPALPEYPQHNGQIKTAAAWLIEQAGFKGRRFGEIGCYEKQPLVLVNYGDGTAEQLKIWLAEIIDVVHQKFGILLEPEVRMLHER